MNYRRNVLIISLMLFVYSAYGQNAELFNYSGNITPSVETYQMERHGQDFLPSNSGAVQFNIPLYVYKDEDFNLPITLNYAYDGYRPSVGSGTVGLGWALSCGGFVTREVRGIPDEEFNNDDSTEGYYHYVSESFYNNEDVCVVSGRLRCPTPYQGELEEIMEANVFSDVPLYAKKVSSTQYAPFKYDTNPDIFRFDFNGYSGKFIIVGPGLIKAYDTSCPPGELNISINCNYPSDFDLPVMSVSIETGDGYTYIFGGVSSAIEYSSSYSRLGFDVSAVSWKLTKICAPNGRTVEFIYSNKFVTEVTVSDHYTPFISAESHPIDLHDYFIGYESVQAIQTVSAISRAQIEKIKIDSSNVVSFSYSDKPCGDYDASDFYGIDVISDSWFPVGVQEKLSYDKLLSNILVLNNEAKEIEKIDFSYVFPSAVSGPSRMFLDHLNIYTKGSYLFSYEFPPSNRFPYNNTKGVDHWGFWNNGSISDIRDIVLYNSNLGLYEQLNSSAKESAYDYSKIGALKAVTYPTGGMTHFEYEPHQASRLIERIGTSTPHLIPNDFNFQPGGIRLKKVINSSENYQDSTIFRYVTYTGSNTSSGILQYMPRYMLKTNFNYVIGQDILTMCVESASLTTEANITHLRGRHMSYSAITALHTDSSYTVYEYNDYSRYPDIYSSVSEISAIRKVYLSMEDYIEYSEDVFTNNAAAMLPPIADLSSMRGRLASQRTYDSSHNLKSSISYTYDTCVVASAKMNYNLLVAYTSQPYLCIHPQLVSEVYNDGYLTTITEFSYNDLGQEVRRSVTSADRKEGTVYYTEYCHSNESRMDICDFIKAVSATAVTKIKDDKEYVTSKSIIGYYNGTSNPYPKDIKVVNYVIPKLFSVPDIFSISSTDTYRSASFSYDNNHRLVQATYPGNSFFSYEWDARGKYIIKKTTNTAEGTFLYEWDDMIGLKKIKYPTGQINTYFYDEKNRFSVQKDSKGITEYIYDIHVKGE